MHLPASFHDLRDRSVFITGGGSGIGEHLVAGFLSQGCKVAFADIRESTSLCDRLEAEHGRRPHFIACDITDIAALKAAIGEARDRHGPIGVLVNNAANDDRHGVDSYSPEEWDRSLNLNLRPHYFTTQAVAGDMRASGGGSIINFSSISYMMGMGDYPAYVAAKAGITGLTRGLARELGGDNIRVNAVMPGWVLTERQQRLWVTEEALAAHVERQCLKETMQPDDLVCPVLFLASQASRMMTGQALVVDGGVVTTG
ncbi:MAG: SDR family oxidoreductase [Pseudomonadota bacterium]|nr:SDR family oxidoreductase [Pseudomonadota bacterium]